MKDHNLEAMILFLEKGARHWSLSADFQPKELWVEMISIKWPELLKFLISTHSQESVIYRITELINQKEYEQLVRKLRASDAEFVINYTMEAQAVARKEKPTQETSLSRSIWQLILVDLVKSYGSLFNRKMFIKRQLVSLSATFQIAYLDLIRIFEEKHAQSSKRNTNSYDLPLLIKSLKDEIRTPSPPSNKLDPSLEWLDWLQFKGIHSVSTKKWQTWTTEYPSAFVSDIKQKITSDKQIDQLVESVSHVQADQLTQLLQPDQASFILGYKKSVIKSNDTTPIYQGSDNSLASLLNKLIFMYLLIDRGTSFNQKEFLKYQIIRLSNHSQLSAVVILEHLVNTIDQLNFSSSNQLIKHIQNIRIDFSYSKAPTKAFETIDEQAVLESYLTSGQIKSIKIATKNVSITELLISKLDQLPNDQMMYLVSNNQVEIIRSSVSYHNAFFILLVSKILMVKTRLSSAEINLVISTIRRSLKKSVDQIGYKRYTLKTILEFGNRLQKHHIQKYNLDNQLDPHSLLGRYFSIKLTHEEFYKQSTSNNFTPSDLSRASPLGYEEAFSNVVITLAKLIRSEKIVSYDLLRTRKSVMKLLESKLETESLFSELDQESLSKLTELLSSAEKRKLSAKLAALIGLKSVEEKFNNASDDMVMAWVRMYRTKIGKSPTVDFSDLKLEARAYEMLQKAKTKVKESATDNTDWVIVTEYLIHGKLPKGISTNQVEHLVIRLFDKHYIRFAEFLHTKRLTQKSILERVLRFPKYVQVRFLQVYTQKQFSDFMKLTNHLEKTLIGINFTFTQDWTDEDFFTIRLKMGLHYQHMSLTLGQITNFYLRYLSDHFRQNIFDLKGQLHLELKQKSLSKRELKKTQIELIKHLDNANKVDLPEVTLKEDARSEETNHHFTKTAGLVLFWPFLKTLFESCGYLNSDNTFKDLNKQTRAVRLLHQIATEEPNAPEYEMTLNKILCGLPFTTPIGPNITLTEKELELTTSVIEGLINHWDRLGQTSIEGFRNSFILREATVEKDDPNWVVRIEKKGIDVLLDYLPFSISGIKLPWTKGMIYVEWR